MASRLLLGMNSTRPDGHTGNVKARPNISVFFLGMRYTRFVILVLTCFALILLDFVEAQARGDGMSQKRLKN